VPASGPGRFGYASPEKTQRRQMIAFHKVSKQTAIKMPSSKFMVYLQKRSQSAGVPLRGEGPAV